MQISGFVPLFSVLNRFYCISIAKEGRASLLLLAYGVYVIFFQATMEDENLCLLKLVNVGPGILLTSNESEQIVQAVTHVKTRWQLSQPVSVFFFLLLKPSLNVQPS